MGGGLLGGCGWTEGGGGVEAGGVAMGDEDGVGVGGFEELPAGTLISTFCPD